MRSPHSSGDLAMALCAYQALALRTLSWPNWDRWTDGMQHHLMPPPLWWEYNNAGTSSNICSTITRDVASVSAPQGLLMPCLGLTLTEMCDASVLWFSASVSALVSGLNALCTFLGLPAATSRNEMKYSDRHCDIHAVRGVKMVPPQSVWKAF